MQTPYIIIIVLILAGIGVAHYQYREKVGLTPDEVRICTANRDCHNVHKDLAQAVLDKAHAVAEADDAEAFPIESIDELDTVYTMDAEALEKIRLAVMSELNINAERGAGNRYFDETKTVNELILFLHFQQQNQSS